MKIQKPITTVIFLYALSIFFFSTSSYSQKHTKSSAEDEQSNKKFKTIREVWTTPFISQGETGTCWSFSTTSFLESEAHRLGRGDFKISQMYTVYYAYLEKAQRHIQSHTENPFSQGGLPHDVIYILGKYGAVPKSDYIGNKDIENKYDHREMFQALSGMLHGVSAAGKDAPLNGQFINGQFHWYWFDGFKNLLNAYIGKPPDSIMNNNSVITPYQFATKVLDLPLHDYIEITSYSHLPFYSNDELLLPDNWLHSNQFYNVPLDEFMKIINHALENGFSLCIDLHATFDELKSKKNYLLGHDEEKDVQITQDKRDIVFNSWRTEDVHLVHIIGTAEDENGKKFYKAKDSVSSEQEDSGPVYNKVFLSENFIKSRVLFVMIHKDGLPADISVKLRIR